MRNIEHCTPMLCVGVVDSLQEIPEEQHQAYREAWDRLMHDTGRNYAPYFAAKFCVIYCPFTFIMQSLIDFFIYKRRKKT